MTRMAALHWHCTLMFICCYAMLHSCIGAVAALLRFDLIGCCRTGKLRTWHLLPHICGDIYIQSWSGSFSHRCNVIYVSWQTHYIFSFGHPLQGVFLATCLGRNHVPSSMVCKAEERSSAAGVHTHTPAQYVQERCAGPCNNRS